MRNILGFISILLAFPSFCFSGKEEILALKEAEGSTLVVGNVRRQGGLQPGMAEIVGQREADFTHRHSFRDVTSLDVAPKGVTFKLSHIQADFLTVERERLPSGLRTIFFEWFPSSCSMLESPHLNQPLLLPALRHAFELLPAGGHIVVDHFPYAKYLEGDPKGALSRLLREGTERTFIRENILTPMSAVAADERPLGMVSHLLQRTDPFTLHISLREKADITQACMVEKLRLEGSDPTTAYGDTASNPGAAVRAARQIAPIVFPGLEIEAAYRRTIAHLSTHGRSVDEHESIVSLWEMFYFMEARRDGMLRALREIGFEVSDDFLQYFEVNPFNRRHHAWIFHARKPSVETASAAVTHVRGAATGHAL